LPWHRVITASGKLAFPQATAGYVRQREPLEQEGGALSKPQSVYAASPVVASEAIT